MHPPDTRHDAFEATHTPDPTLGDRACIVCDEAAPDDPPSANPGTLVFPRTLIPLPDSDIISQFRRLADDNESLRRELTRAYERLNVVLELSRGASPIENPNSLRSDLLHRYAATLGVTGLFIDDGGTCSPVADVPQAVGLAEISPEIIHATLADEIAEVRTTRRGVILDCTDTALRGLLPCHALLSAFQEESPTTRVIIALRKTSQKAFDDDDRLAAETVLVYGGHILRNTLMLQHLKHSSLETVGALANAIEARDQYTGGHSERVGWLASLTGKSLNLPPDDLQMLEWSGLLHDVGKIGIPEHILNKPGALTDEEFEYIKRHPRLGYDVLRPVSSLRPVLEAVLYHHENWDGSGYPEGLKGEEIPLLARILHVVDIFDALTSTRSYRRRLDMDLALRMLKDSAGRDTDPLVTTAFIEAFRDYADANPRQIAERFGHD